MYKKSKYLFLLLVTATLCNQGTYAYAKDHQNIEKSQFKSKFKIAFLAFGTIAVALVLKKVVHNKQSGQKGNNEKDKKINIDEYYLKSTENVDDEEIDFYTCNIDNSKPEQEGMTQDQLWKKVITSLADLLKNKEENYAYGISILGKTKDISSLKKLLNKGKLKSLALSRLEKVKNFDIIKSFPSLIELDIKNNKDSDITSLDFIKPLKKLKILTLEGFEKVKNIEAIKSTKKLESVALNRFEVHDLAPLGDLANLGVLELDNFYGLENLHPLESLQNTLKTLKLLNLAKTKDFSVVGKLIKLHHLWLKNIPLVDDLSFLHPLGKLKELYLKKLPQVEKNYHCTSLLLDKVGQMDKTRQASPMPKRNWTKKEATKRLHATQKKVAKLRVDQPKFAELEKLVISLPLAYCFVEKGDLAAFSLLPKIKVVRFLYLKAIKDAKEDSQQAQIRKAIDYDLKESNYEKTFEKKKIKQAVWLL